MNPFWHNIFNKSGYEQSLAYFLGTVPAFTALEKNELAVLEHIVHLRNYQTDESVFTQGDIGSGMYMVRSGQVRITTQGEKGQPVEQALLAAGDCFGEVALTASRPRCATATATEPTVLVGLFRADIDEAIRRHPKEMAKVMYGLNRIISDRLLECYQQLEGFKKHLRERPGDEWA